jgi:polysaccharide deacetylase family protein (PEP-CTERM system associated)
VTGTRPPVTSNALTFDVEDWNQLVEWKLTGTMPECSPNVVGLTSDILNTLSRHGVRATFFVLAHVARAFPALVRDIHAAGHEVASHGWSHRLIYRQTRDEFARESRDAKALLEDVIGSPISGYRAAEFSITDASRWALDVLAETGFTYDSSIFPMAGKRYGIPDAPLGAHRVRTASGAEITELPMTVVEWGSKRLPVGGGGYFRLLPYAVTRAAIARVNAQGRPAVLYFHPYEFSQKRLTPKVTAWRQYLTSGRYSIFHNFNRRTNRDRFERLLRDCRLVPAAEIVQRG